MDNSLTIVFNPLAIPILLLITSITPALLPRKNDFSIRITQLLLLITITITIICCFLVPYNFMTFFSLVHYDHIGLNLALGFDMLTRIMLIFILIIGTMIYSYARNYLQSDITRIRFLGQFSLLLVSVSLLAMAENLLAAFFAWQFIGLSLYLLLNHYHYDQDANKAAKKKFVINRLGDCCFLLAVVIAYHTEQSTLFTMLTNSTHANLICSLIFVCVMTKCAQFPFHVWLIDTMETPTPVSAMMHAGVINAGGILLTRISPIFITQQYLIYTALSLGLVTALLSIIWMNQQADTKKKLAYSTMGQMGYMLSQCSLGAFPAAVFHLISHGFFKASLFLNAGETLQAQPQPELHSTYSQLALACLAASIIFIPALMIAIHLQLDIPTIMYGLTFATILSFCRTSIVNKNSLLSLAAQLLLITFMLATFFFILHNFSSLLIEYEFAAPISETAQVIIVSILLITQCILWTRKQPQNNYKFSDNVEPLLRKLLLRPLRRLGVIFYHYFHHGRRRHRLALICTPLYLSLLYALLIVPNLGANTIEHLFFTYLFLLLALFTLSTANRCKKLSHLILWLGLFEICFSNIALYDARSAIYNIGLFHVINVSSIILILVIILQQTKVKAKTVPLSYNKLPIRLVYLVAALLLLIGVPGTASFISEFYLLNALFHDGVIAASLYLTSIILLSIVIMHALQLYAFNPRYSHALARPLTKKIHALFIAIIFVNLLLGIRPSLLLNVLPHY